MTDLSRDDAQHVLDTCHNETMECMQMYASGLITLPEMVNHLILVKRVYISIPSLDGLFDPATGLSLHAPEALGREHPAAPEQDTDWVYNLNAEQRVWLAQQKDISGS